MRLTRPRFPPPARTVAARSNAPASPRSIKKICPSLRPIVRRFDVHIGGCVACGRRVQGRHPLQTSDAVGAANVHLGPRAVTLIVLLHKHVGVSLEKIATLLRDRFGLRVMPGGLVQTLHRAARVAAPGLRGPVYPDPRESRRQSR